MEVRVVLVTIRQMTVCNGSYYLLIKIRKYIFKQVLTTRNLCGEKSYVFTLVLSCVGVRMLTSAMHFSCKIWS